MTTLAPLGALGARAGGRDRFPRRPLLSLLPSSWLLTFSRRLPPLRNAGTELLLFPQGASPRARAAPLQSREATGRASPRGRCCSYSRSKPPAGLDNAAEDDRLSDTLGHGGCLVLLPTLVRYRSTPTSDSCSMNEQACRRPPVRECLGRTRSRVRRRRSRRRTDCAAAMNVASFSSGRLLGSAQRLAAPASRLSLPRTWCTGSPSARAFETRSCFNQRETPSGRVETIISS